MILAGDVGATKVLLEAGDFNGERWQPVHARRYLIADFDNFADVLDAFMAELGRKGRFKAAALGVAGLAQGNKVKMTHRPWTVDGAIIARRFGIPRVGVVNDLAAAAQGIDGLAAKDLITVQPGKVDRQAPRLVMGVGTGLGVAFLLPSTWCQAPGQSKRTGRSTGPAGYLARVAPGEGGHTGFSPASAKQAALWQALHKAHGRVELEDLCSGRGLANIYEILCASGECPVGSPSRVEPAWVTEQAHGGSNSGATAALDLFAECMGNIAGDHALTLLATGGVYLAGGVVAKIAPSFNFDAFRAAFCAKGLFASRLMRVPVKLVTNENLPVIGAARIAASL